jgi:PAS domain S-box-containing protein
MASTQADGLIPLQTGALTAQQIALLLTYLPVDVTYVDENDEVRFFSATKERIFQRSPAIIGRKVQQCHPPASVHRVQRILDDLRAGRRDVAEFWIQMSGKFVHIRYFAVRDEQGKYRGVLEVSQDVTAIRALQGERRLLAEDA